MSQADQGTRRPSVAHVVSYYPPDRVGGVGEHVRVLHEGYQEVGDSVVVTSGLSRDDSTVMRVGKTPNQFFLASWKGARVLRERDIVQVHHGEGLLLALAVRLRRRRPRILTMFHVDVRARERASAPHVFEGRRFGPKGMSRLKQVVLAWPKAVVDRIVWILADAVVVETNAVKEEVADLRPRRPVTVIPHGLGDSPASNDDRDPVEILYVGTPGIRKRTHLLPSILYGVQQHVPAARLRVVGFGSDADPGLKAEAIRLGVLDSFDFVGPVRSEQVVSYYRSAQVLILPSVYEGLPMVLLEAMREGLIPVATRVSGHPDAIHDGSSGYLVELDDVESFIGRCVALLRDPGLRQRMGAAARQVVTDNFAVDTEIERYRRLYLKVTQLPGST